MLAGHPRERPKCSPGKVQKKLPRWGSFLQRDAAPKTFFAWVDPINLGCVAQRGSGPVPGRSYFLWSGVRTAVPLFARLHTTSLFCSTGPGLHQSPYRRNRSTEGRKPYSRGEYDSGGTPPAGTPRLPLTLRLFPLLLPAPLPAGVPPGAGAAAGSGHKPG